MVRSFWFVVIGIVLAAGCSKHSSSPGSVTPLPGAFKLTGATFNGISLVSPAYSFPFSPIIRCSFSSAVDHGSAANGISLKDDAGVAVNCSVTYTNGDSTMVIQPGSSLKPLTQYVFALTTNLASQQNMHLPAEVDYQLITAIDSTDKFPQITDSALLDLVESQTFGYFYGFGHPVCGMARERNTSGDVVTTGGTGFGIMAMLAAIKRGFITRVQGLNRMDTIVDFLTNKTTRYHGAFSHWINGATGATVPFSTQDDGGDIVETSYLMQGLLCARQYFNSATDLTETALRAAINQLYAGIDWGWYRRGGLNVLYWNWSPDYNWAVNVPVQGWNEALITYVLAASAPTDPIPKTTYDSGWAGNGSMRNGNTYYGTVLPLGPSLGGPLFFAHYSFLGIDPNGLMDAYANYWTQNTAHTMINYSYCVANPGKYNGYSSQCWGLTASDDNVSGYSAHSPTNDPGIISPTAAVSSLPYAPTQAMDALKFFYYKLGDKIWGQYGFADAFNLTKPWFATSYLAIDQGPEIVMIENYRSGLLWNLFMSCPEVQNGMKMLGFSSPHF